MPKEKQNMIDFLDSQRDPTNSKNFYLGSGKSDNVAKKLIYDETLREQKQESYIEKKIRDRNQYNENLKNFKGIHRDYVSMLPLQGIIARAFSKEGSLPKTDDKGNIASIIHPVKGFTVPYRSSSAQQIGYYEEQFCFKPLVVVVSTPHGSMFQVGDILEILMKIVAPEVTKINEIPHLVVENSYLRPESDLMDVTTDSNHVDFGYFYVPMAKIVARHGNIFENIEDRAGATSVEFSYDNNLTSDFKFIKSNEEPQ